MRGEGTGNKATLLLIRGACIVRELSYQAHCFGLHALAVNPLGGSVGLAFYAGAGDQNMKTGV